MPREMRDAVIRVRLTEERNADLERMAGEYGVASATMATIIIGEWLREKKGATKTPIHSNSMKPMNAIELRTFLFTHQGASFTGECILVENKEAWRMARDYLLEEYDDGEHDHYLPFLQNWLDLTVAPRTRYVKE